SIRRPGRKMIPRVIAGSQSLSIFPRRKFFSYPMSYASWMAPVKPECRHCCVSDRAIIRSRHTITQPLRRLNESLSQRERVIGLFSVTIPNSNSLRIEAERIVEQRAHNRAAILAGLVLAMGLAASCNSRQPEHPAEVKPNTPETLAKSYQDCW